MGGPAVKKGYFFDFFLANSDSCRIHRRVAAADDSNVSFGQFPASQIELLEELHGRIDSLNVFSFQIQTPAFIRSDGKENRLKTIVEELVDSYVPAQLSSAF